MEKWDYYVIKTFYVTLKFFLMVGKGTQEVTVGNEY